MKYKYILEKIQKQNAQLVAVSKTRSISEIMKLYDQGQRVFGENRVQELKDKYEAMPKDIEWHLIGHLQKNKVKYIAPSVYLIHSVDSIALLQTIQKEAVKNDRSIPILLQIKIAKEEAKTGWNFTELDSFLGGNNFESFRNIQFSGVMGMASFVSDKDQIRLEFQTLKGYFVKLKKTHFPDHEFFNEISMGMSSDFEIALEEGATIVRLGSLLFGTRSY